jgi:predicted dehydrogenase
MAMNAAEAREMTHAALGAGRLAMIDHELRFQPGRQAAYRMLREGAIGKVRRAKYHFRAPHRGDPSVPWNWWSDVNKGGGALGAIGSHIIDSFNWFLGTDISSVFCQLQTHVKRRRDHAGVLRDVTSDDEANMLLRFHDSPLTEDATGDVSLSMVEGPSYQNRIEFHGTGGALRIEHRGEVYIAENGKTEWTAVEADIGSNIEGVADTGFSRGFMEFAPKIVEALSTGSDNIEHAATFEDGSKVQLVLDAARESNAQGRSVTPQYS